MRRLPSAGFVWLAATVAACLGLWRWVDRPFFWERPQPEASLQAAGYLVRLARGAEGGERERWLRKCYHAALQHGLSAGEWRPLFHALEAMRAADLDTVLLECWCIAPGLCWLVGADGEGRCRAGGPSAVLLCNEGRRPVEVELRWEGGPEAGARVAVPGAGGDEVLVFAGGAARQVVVVPAGGCVVVPVTAAVPQLLRLVAAVDHPS